MELENIEVYKDKSDREVIDTIDKIVAEREFENQKANHDLDEEVNDLLRKFDRAYIVIAMGITAEALALMSILMYFLCRDEIKCTGLEFTLKMIAVIIIGIALIIPGKRKLNKYDTRIKEIGVKRVELDDKFEDFASNAWLTQCNIILDRIKNRENK